MEVERNTKNSGASGGGVTPLLRSDPVGGSELDPGCSNTINFYLL